MASPQTTPPALKEAEQALEKATHALDGKFKKDFFEMMGFVDGQVGESHQNHQQLARHVCHCAAILKGGKDVTWERTSAMMKDTNFVRSLVEFDKEALDDTHFQQVKAYLSKSNIRPEDLLTGVKKFSNAATNLLTWVITVLDYYEAAHPEV